MYLARLTSTTSKLKKKSSILNAKEDNNKKKTIEINKLASVDGQNSIAKILNNAISSGDLNLSNKNLKEFPKYCNMFNLIDTINCDLSKNQLNEFPKEICIFIVLETLILYSNNIKSIHNNVFNLKSLKFLDLNSNSLTFLPSSVCSLKLLEVLNVNNNKLVSLPEEIFELEKLIQLDVSCNEIQNIPITIGEMKSLRSLNIRRNLLVEMPSTISKCKLVNLDCSFNRLTKLPNSFREIITLIDLNVESNPLESPPASLCTKGILHIMKYLLNETIKEEKKQGILSENESFQYGNGLILDKKYSKQNSILNFKDETSFAPCNENSREKEKVYQTREMSKKTNEEQFVVLERQINQMQKVSMQITNKDSKQYRHENMVQPLNENFINKDKIYSKDRSYKSLNNLENDQYNSAIIMHHDANQLYLENLNINKNQNLARIMEEKNRSHELRNENSKVINNIDHSNNNFSRDEKWTTMPKHSPTKTLSNNYKYKKEEGVSIDVESISGNSSNIKDSVFTMRRNLYHHHEELQEVEFLKHIIESKLKIILHDDVASCIKNGVILCHLLNHIYPRAIQIIHVPSMAMPTLSMAKSRKNVESFIEACQKFGLNPNEICSSQDIIESKNTHKVSRTIMNIIKYNQEISHQNRPLIEQQQTAV